MRFDKKSLSLSCAKQLISFIKPFVNPKFAESNNINDIVNELNDFLNVVYHILNVKTKYTTSNYKVRGQYLLAFSELYQYLVLHQECKSAVNYLIGQDKSWTKFLCSSYKNIIPFVHVYKVLAIIGLISAKCYNDIFYIKSKTNKGKEPTWLTLEQIIDNLYNPNLRFSKSKSKTCLETLDAHVVTDVNKYIYMSYYIRSKYLEAEFCGMIINIQSDKEHEQFTNCIEELVNSLNKYRKSHL